MTTPVSPTTSDLGLRPWPSGLRQWPVSARLGPVTFDTDFIQSWYLSLILQFIYKEPIKEVTQESAPPIVNILALACILRDFSRIHKQDSHYKPGSLRCPDVKLQLQCFSGSHKP